MSEKAIGLFDIINDISFGKKGIAISETGEIEKAFNQWIAVENFSHFPDTVHIALEASKLKVSDEIMHTFLMTSILKRKRFEKWFKQDKERVETISLLAKHFEWSSIEAEKMLHMFSEEEIEKIRQIYEDPNTKIKVTKTKPHKVTKKK